MSQNNTATPGSNLVPGSGASRFAARVNNVVAARGGVRASERSIEIMVTGDPRRVRRVADTVNQLQQHLSDGHPRGKLWLKITAFLDRCRHTTGWSDQPTDVGGGANWDCYQERTLFADAFEASHRDNRKINYIIMYGDRFSTEDDLNRALKEAEALHKKNGTRVIALHTGDDAASREAFQRIADCTNGAFLQLTDESSIADIMPALTEFITRGEKALAMLEAPDNPDIAKLLRDLTGPRGAPTT